MAFGFEIPIKQKSRAFRPLRGRVHFFDKRQRNEPKKTLCAQGKPGASLMKGFFERASCPREKRRTSLCGALRVRQHHNGGHIFRNKNPKPAARARAKAKAKAKARYVPCKSRLALRKSAAVIALPPSRCRVRIRNAPSPQATSTPSRPAASRVPGAASRSRPIAAAAWMR